MNLTSFVNFNNNSGQVWYHEHCPQKKHQHWYLPSTLPVECIHQYVFDLVIDFENLQ